MKNVIVSSWNLVMDSRRNPLRHLDIASQHYFMQVLGWMWSMVFCLSFLSIFYFHYVWMGHLLVIGGICFTVATFRKAEEAAEKSQRLVRNEAFVDGGERRSHSAQPPVFGRSSVCLWKMDREA